MKRLFKLGSVPRRLLLLGTIALALLGGTAACASNAQVASHNVSQAADNFEVQRKIVFFNGITDKYLLEVQGRCSITQDQRQLEVICKIGPDTYIKHFLGLSDNVSYFAEQTTAVPADVWHYRVFFKPEVVLPNFDRPAGG